MIVRPRPHWLRMLFVLRGSVLPDIAPQLLLATGFAVLVTLANGQFFRWKIELTFVPFSLIGVTLAIFLGFRNNTSYARFWEARMLWGSVLNETRNLARQALTSTLPPPDAPARTTLLVHRLIGFVHALRHQLRGTDPTADFARLLPPADVQRLAGLRFAPSMLLLMVGEWLGDMRQRGALSPALALAAEAPLGRLCDALGGCERIANTPIPFTYSVIIHRTVYFYCLLLPFGLVDSLGQMTPVITAFIAYTFFALEALSAEIEQPFGTAPNDLPLDALAWGIEATLLEMLGRQPQQPEPEVVDCLLN